MKKIAVFVSAVVFLLSIYLYIFLQLAQKKDGFVLQTPSDEITDLTPYSQYIISEETILEATKKQFVTPEVKDGYSWMAKQIQPGMPKMRYVNYQVVYNKEGQLLAKTEVPGSEVIVEGEPAIYQYYALPEIGTVFFPKITKYGADCAACYPNELGQGNTSSGVKIGISSVRQMDGSWKEGITYEGYYVVASSQALPLCTTLIISDHSFTGMGLEPGVPFKAIVLDRGVSGSTLDLFVGSEYNLEVVHTTGSQSPMATITGFGTRSLNQNGSPICTLPEEE